MDRTTQRKFLCDSTGTFHFVYPSKGYIYFTQSYDPSKIWETAVLLGRGKWPAMALTEHDYEHLFVWHLPCDSICYRDYSTTIPPYPPPKYCDTLALTGDPGPVAMDYAFSYNGEGGYEIPKGLPGHAGGGGGMPPIPDSLLEGMVHLAYITRGLLDNQDKLYYAYFPKDDPDDLTEELVDGDLDEGTSHDTIGASIELDPQYGKVSIAYGCVKNDTAACYYREKTIYGWSDWYRFPTSISATAGEPLVPFVDIAGGYVRVVFNANDSIWVAVKSCADNYNAWDAVIAVSGQASGENRYPQIADSMITWTNGTGNNRHIFGVELPDLDIFRVDSAYGDEQSYFCHVTHTDQGPACLYQHGHVYGPFTGPKWAIFYRRPDGFGGNMESPPPGITGSESSPRFTMAISRHILNGNQLSVFTTDECELAAYDVTGRRVARFKVEANAQDGGIETPIDCTHWASGVYFVRAVHEADNETITRTEKVVLLR